MERKNWAIVDDELIFHLTTKELIKHVKLERNVLGFRNGRELLEYLYNNKESPELLPDIVLLDLKMPIMDGWDFISDYMGFKDQLAKEVSIYILSSSVDQNDLDRAKEFSIIRDYIIKPIDEHKLEKIVTDLAAA